MAARMTPEELAAIRKRNDWLMESVTNRFHPTQMEQDRAALLRHVEALELEAKNREEGWREHVIDLHDKILTLEQEVARLRGLSETATNRAMLEHDRTEVAERKLARLVDGLEAVIDTAIRQDDFPDIDRLQALIKEAQATGEGK